MKVTLTPLAAPSLVMIRFDWEELSTQFDSEWKIIKDRLDLKGFRKGKVPRSIAEKRIGVNELYKTTITDAVNRALDDIKKDIVHVDKITIIQFEENKPIVMRTYVDLKPKVKLKKTTGFDVTIVKMLVTTEIIDAKVKKLQARQSISMSIEDRGSEEGDFVDVQSTILIDGQPFDNNKGMFTARLKVGNLNNGASVNKLIRGIVVKDNPTGVVEFPDTFMAPLLRGKKTLVTFEVLNVTKIEVPEINDEFAKSNGYKNLKELRHHCEIEAEEEKNKHRDVVIISAILDKIIEINEVGPVPDSLFNRQIRIMLNDYLKQIGLSETEFFTQTQTSFDHFSNQNADLALHRIKTRLILEKSLDENAKIKVKEEEIDARLKRVAKLSDQTYEALNTPDNRVTARYDVGTEKELDRIKKTVKVIEKEQAKK